MSRFVPRFHSLLVLSSFLFFSGCAYVHFGRIDKAYLDAKLAEENSDLRVDKKLLQQELVIAQKENNTLRVALERQPTASGAQDLVAKLNETTRELATLRADYARLQSERQKLEGAATSPDTGSANMAALEQIADLKGKLTDNEDRLASTLRLYTQLQEENAKLRTEVDQAHAENATLSKQVAQANAQYGEARDALAQLNTEFLAQKEARSRAEQDAQALRAQLRSLLERSRVDAAPASTAVPSLASAREGTASGAAELTSTAHVDADQGNSPVTAALTTNREKLRAVPDSTPKPAAPPQAAPASDTTATPPSTRTYVVQPGDTIEQLAEKFYGRRDKWRLIYAANNAQLSGGRPLQPGMQLEIPADE